MTTGVVCRALLIIRETRRILWLNLLAFSIAVLALGTIVAGLEIGASEYAANLYGSLAGFVASAVLNFQAVAKSGWANSDIRPRLVALFGLSVVSSILILVGGILLILPGIFLYLRWFISWPMLVDANIGIMDAMRESWRLMTGWELPVLLLITGLFVPIAALIGLIEAMVPELGFGSALALNLTLNVALLLSYLMAVACLGIIKHSIGREIPEA